MSNFFGQNDKMILKEEQRRIEKEAAWILNPKKCKFCQKDILFKNKNYTFCNSDCNKSFYLAKRKTCIENKQNKFKNCIFCGELTNSIYANFCSSKCKVENEWKIKIEKVKKDGILYGSNNRKKAMFLKIVPRECSICKIKEWNGKPAPLILDHIDGSHSNEKLSNFRLVCGNCDMQLPTYKSKNKGKGNEYDRTYRKNKYKYSAERVDYLEKKVVELANNLKTLSSSKQKEACDNGIRPVLRTGGDLQNLLEVQVLSLPPFFENKKCKICKLCGSNFTNKNAKHFCSSKCAKIGGRKVKRPTWIELKEELKIHPMTTIAAKYGVSDNAIRKWIKYFINTE